MYRRNNFLGCGMTAFSIGLLLGLWIEKGFWAHLVGFCLLILGGNLLCKR